MALILVMLPSLVLGLPFRGDPYYHMAISSQGNDAADLLMGATVDIGRLEVNPFFVAYVAACIWAYASDPEAPGWRYRAVYLCALVFVFFCTLVRVRPYWLVLYVPFMALVVATAGHRRPLAILVETVTSVCGALYLLATYWIYSTWGLCRNLVLGSLRPAVGCEYRWTGIAGFLDEVGVWRYEPLLWAVFVAGVAALLVLLRPSWREGPSRDVVPSARPDVPLMLLARPTALLAIVVALVCVSMATQPVPAFGSEEALTVTSHENLVSGSTTSLPVSFSDDRDLTAFGICLQASEITRIARSSLAFELCDDASGEVVWEGSLAVTDIRSGHYSRLPIDGVRVLAGKGYVLSIGCTVPVGVGSSSSVSYCLSPGGGPAAYFL